MKQLTSKDNPKPRFYKTLYSFVSADEDSFCRNQDTSDPQLYRSRGEVLVSVLNGTCSTQVQAIQADTDNNPDSPIDYHPDGDCRLDRFDGLELGYGLMDQALDEHPSAREDNEDKSTSKDK
ncbi:hypothetical protein [Peromfec virus RodF8_20]|uniref:Uncharacterized protein n=1 Tax=Peromfec virus RodF8_20 TaxID=2929362 RepID=A0A976N262_9VIRU|nr:hypothetical protein [Peromfec virus RodF8_20]